MNRPNIRITDEEVAAYRKEHPEVDWNLAHSRIWWKKSGRDGVEWFRDEMSRLLGALK